MPRFVVLRHELPNGSPKSSHWDFMLEGDGVLLTWSLPHSPNSPKSQWVEKLIDHRIEYLEYEGEVSGGRGHVARWDAGTYEREISNRALCVRLNGAKLKGTVSLSECGGSPEWSFEFVPDSPGA